MTVADRLVQELMLVSVLVAGAGADGMAAELEAAGASVEVLAGETSGGVDLAILLAAPDAADDPGLRAIVTILSGASERLLFAPARTGGEIATDTPALKLLNQWFEVFAELGYQPVVEFDASFVCPGAFLVDRAATAAENELAAFADRLQRGASSDDPARASLSDAAGQPDARDRLLDSLAQTEAALAETRAELAAARDATAAHAARADDLARQLDASKAALRGLDAANVGWDALRAWVRAACSTPSHDTLATLARDLPRLNQLRGSAPLLPPLAPAKAWRPWRRRRADSRVATILADTALVRASPLFDAAWYIASTPDLATDRPVDPVFHYVLVGSLHVADPGPWFDSQAYLAAHPHLELSQVCLLVHAIRNAADQSVPVTS